MRCCSDGGAFGRTHVDHRAHQTTTHQVEPNQTKSNHQLVGKARKEQSSAIQPTRTTHTMSFLHQAANLAQRTVVLGLVGLTGYQAYQITTKATAYRKEMADNNGAPQQSHPQADYIQTLRDKSEEEYKKLYKTDHRDWYDKDDDSYLKDAPRVKNNKVEK